MSRVLSLVMMPLKFTSFALLAVIGLGLVSPSPVVLQAANARVFHPPLAARRSVDYLTNSQD